MQIKDVKITNYKSIKNSTVEQITKLFALVGKNNTGKSSFLEAVRILLCDKKLEKSDFHKGTDENIEISGTVIDGEKNKKELKVECNRELNCDYFINDESVSKRKYKQEVPDLLIIPDIRNPEEFYTKGRRKTLLEEILESWKQEGRSEENMKKITKEMEEIKTKEAQEVSENLTNTFQEITGDKSFSISIKPQINLQKGVEHNTNIKNKNIDMGEIDIMESGTGLQSMYLLSLLEVYGESATEKGKTIFLVEEPEVYLHPEYQRRMFNALRKIASSSQVIFTTHSPIMIADNWLTESVRQVTLNEKGETKIKNVKIESVINELGIRYEDVLNPSLIIFVEGKTDIKFYKKRLDKESHKIKFISTDGFRALQYFAFIKIIMGENVNNDFILIADSDGQEIEERKKELKNKICEQFNEKPEGIEDELEDKIFVLNKYAIESYFLEPKVLNNAFSDIKEVQINKFIEEYKECYEEKKKELKANEIGLKKIQQYLKPKIIFEQIENDDYKEAYKNFWDDYDNFLDVREKIVMECQKKQDWFDYVLDYINLNEIKEFQEKYNKISELCND